MAQTFKKRAGTTDRGKDYEHLYIAHSILKLIEDDTIEDFYLSSNDDKYGSFDDIVIEIKYYEKTQTEVYAIQLKQSRKKILRSRNLTAPKGDFSISKYFQDYNVNLEALQRPVKRILFTNCTAKIPEKIQVILNGEEVDVDITKCTPDDLVTTSEDGFCYSFNANCHNTFFDNFFLYTNQYSVHQIEAKTSEKFKNTFGVSDSTFRDYFHLINEWSKREGTKDKLSKAWMKQLIATCVLSPFIKPLSFSIGEVSRKAKCFREAVSKCFITRLDSESFDNIKDLWQDVVNEEELRSYHVCKLRFQYQILSAGGTDDSSINKLLWLLEKCPLVVDGWPEVFKAIKMCTKGYFVVLCSPHTKYFFDDFQRNLTNAVNKRFFLYLSDLKGLDVYETVLQDFTYSLEGQKEASLQTVVQWNKNLESFITTDRLVKMIHQPVIIGKQKETLPPCHIPRNLTKILINPQFLKNCDKSLVLVGYVEDFNVFREKFDSLPATIVDGSNMFPGVFKPNIIYIDKSDITRKQFDDLCLQYSTQRKCHHFRFVNESSFEWVRSHGGVKKLKKFRLEQKGDENFIYESSFFDDGDDINIVCANSGMGKSTLMKSLKTESPSTLWTVLIYARMHALEFRNKDIDVDDFKKYILNFCKDCGDLDKKIYKTLAESNQLQIIWDGLDEVSDACLDAVLRIVEKISKTPIKQWITSRSHLRKILERKFATFSRDINQLSKKDQRMYVKTRLDLSDSELADVFEKIKSNIAQYSNTNILGIPLQISMLVELLLRNKDKFSNLLTFSFTVVNLYKNFVDEKFKIYFQDKIKYDLTNERHFLEYEDEKWRKMEFYTKAAFRLHLESKVKKKIRGSFRRIVGNSKILERVKTKGDEIGLICTINRQGDPEFIHNSYGEYFAALYLFHHDSSITKERKFSSNKKLDNVRFFLDVMLAKNSKAHIAVLYKNCRLLDECTEEDLDRVDLIGRNVLEVSCAWNNKGYLIEQNYLKINEIKNEDVLEAFGKIKTLTTCERKILLLMPFLIPAYDSSFESNVIICGIRFDYDVLVYEYLQQVKFSGSIEHLYDIAVKFGSKKCIRIFMLDASYTSEILRNVDNILKLCTLEFEEIFVDVLSSSQVDINHLLRIACEGNQTTTAKFLIERGACVNVHFPNGQLPIHHATQRNHLFLARLLMDQSDLDVPDYSGRLPIHYSCLVENFDLVKLLLEKNSKLDVADARGRLPIHYACDKGNSRTIKLLIEKNSSLDVADANGSLPIHYACARQNLKVIELLLKTSPTLLDVEDGFGRLPIHYACEKGTFEVVKMLMDKDSKLDVSDARDQLPIHYACKKRSLEIVELLVEKSGFVNVPDGSGRLPIHLACEMGTLKMVKLLVDSDAKLDVADDDGRLPVHCACSNEFSGFEIVQFLIKKNVRLDVRDRRGQLPVYYTRTNMVCGKKIEELFESLQWF